MQLRCQRYIFVIISGLLLSNRATAQVKPYRGAEYRTKVPERYGRFEVRMKSSFGSGMLTSFFTFHDNDPDPVANWNEIDIEIMGRYTNEVQFNTITPHQVGHDFRQVVAFNPHQAFHVYGIEWTPDYVAWRVDGYEIYRQSGAHIPTLQLAQKIMMNIWQPTFVDWAGTFDARILPVYGYYDWVKYYAYTPGENDNFTLLWSDDFDAWDSLRWDKATHTFFGNNAQFIPENVVFQDGYLILCLTTPNATGYAGGPVVDEDVDAPYLVRAHAAANRIRVLFSEALDPGTAQVLSKYIVPGVTLTSARLLADQKTVELAADTVDLTQPHLLIVGSGINDLAEPPNASVLQNIDISNGLTLPVRINSGGFQDGQFLGDSTWDVHQEYGRVGGTARQLAPGTSIQAPENETIYRTFLDGLTFYNVRVLDGVYSLSLMFLEHDFAQAGKRVFDVYTENRLVAQNVDVFAAAGQNAAFELRVNDVVVSDGTLSLYFKPQQGTSMLSGLQVASALPTAVEGNQSSVPFGFSLDVFPNPFNPSTTLRYVLNRAGTVEVTVVNVRGQRVRTLTHGRKSAGQHLVRFDASGLTSGVYFVRLVFDRRLAGSRKVLYLR